MRSAVFILLIAVCSCTGRTREQKTIVPEQTVLYDSTYIFNGKDLEGWEITNYGPQGSVEVSGGNIILGFGDGCTGVTYKREVPETDYEVTLEAKRAGGSDFFCGMTFPVDKSPCTLIVGGWGGTVVGLSSINGKDASENETTKLMKFDNDRWYRIRLRVSEGTIKAWIDDEMVIDFIVGTNRLSIRPEVNLNRPFGIASWNTTAALRNIRLVTL